MFVRTCTLLEWLAIPSGAALCLVFGAVLYLAALQAHGLNLGQIFRLGRAQAG